MKEKNQRESFFFTQVIGQSLASSPSHSGFSMLHAENWEWPGEEAGQD